VLINTDCLTTQRTDLALSNWYNLGARARFVTTTTAVASEALDQEEPSSCAYSIRVGTEHTQADN
jgi:hypothetical protein